MFDIAIDLKPFYYFLQRYLLLLSCEFHKNRKKEQMTMSIWTVEKKQEQITSMRIKILGVATAPSCPNGGPPMFSSMAETI